MCTISQGHRKACISNDLTHPVTLHAQQGFSGLTARLSCPAKLVVSHHVFDSGCVKRSWTAGARPVMAATMLIPVCFNNTHQRHSTTPARAASVALHISTIGGSQTLPWDENRQLAGRGKRWVSDHLCSCKVRQVAYTKTRRAQTNTRSHKSAWYSSQVTGSWDRLPLSLSHLRRASLVS